ncbi:glutactin-like [Episyrphus balteatus]|uniref:glutactin-like n=1 Tax=Episyrphus balteatus TaxID=286459 RepID=UPI0024868680|nr:glutactin-like [Episyrphus balteatus]
MFLLCRSIVPVLICVFVSFSYAQEAQYVDEYDYDQGAGGGDGYNPSTTPTNPYAYRPGLNVIVDPSVRTYVPSYYRPPPLPSYNDPNVIALPNAAGYVRGKEIRSAYTGKNFKAFLGIKYGSVGSGLERFQAARQAPISNGIINATVEPMACPQFPDLLKVEQAERQGINVDDCLTLSIFTPNIYGNHPVMIYVHGEMLFDGSAEEAKPEYLLEKDIVLVSVNYRLAPFGFLSTQTDDIPGNIALSDLELATRWIEENIAAFGGDPRSVTLFGQAGGATLVHALSLSERVNPVNFDRLILQSGTALNPLFIDEDPLATARAIGREARCPYNSIHSPYELNHCLGRLKTSELLSAFVDHCNHNEERGLYSYGGSKLAVGDKHGYIPMHPALMLKNFKLPLLAGMTKDAGAFILTRKYDELVRVNSRNISDYINVVLKYTTLPKYYSTWRNWALEYIFSPQDIQNPVLGNLASGLLELTNLILYKAPLMESIKSAWNTNSTYLYSFDYRGQFHRFPKRRTHFPYELDANLSDDNMYLFPYPEEVSRLNSVDRSVSQMMVTMWTNFATSENPDQRSWPKMNNQFGPFVRIGRSLELDYHFGDGVASPDLYADMRRSMNNTSAVARFG